MAASLLGLAGSAAVAQVGTPSLPITQATHTLPSVTEAAVTRRQSTFPPVVGTTVTCAEWERQFARRGLLHQDTSVARAGTARATTSLAVQGTGY